MFDIKADHITIQGPEMKRKVVTLKISAMKGKLLLNHMSTGCNVLPFYVIPL